MQSGVTRNEPRPESAVGALEVPTALSRNAVARLLSELEGLAQSQVRILVLRGATTTFCRGMDLDEISVDADSTAAPAWRHATEDFVRVLRWLRETKIVTVAIVEGAALGGGVGLAAACDFVLATDAATFALPELLLGLVPAMILPVLAERLGLQPAKRWAMTQATWKAEDAKIAGLVDQVTPAERLDVELRRLTRTLLRSHPRGIAGLKQLVSETRGMEPMRATEHGRNLLGSLLEQAAIRRELVAFRDHGLLPGEAEA